MARKRISIPIRVVNGDVEMVEDDESDFQSILHHVETKPADHPLRRLLGTEWKYNVMLNTALEAVYDLRMNMIRYETGSIIAKVEAIFSANDLRVILSWNGYALRVGQKGE